MIDGFGTVLDANAAAAALFGCSLDQLIGHNIGHFVALDQLPSSALGRLGGMNALLDGPQLLGGLRSNGEAFDLTLTLTQEWFKAEAYYTGVLKEVSTSRADPAPSAAPAEPANPDIPSLKPLHILLVEDHPINQVLAGLLLGQLGHSHVSANNGQEALDQHATQAFDLILMDLMMPVMDGLSALAAIRAREAGGARRTPIVVVTAHAMPGDRERLLTAGADGYVSKPISAHALQSEMRRVMSLAEPSSGTDGDSSKMALNLLSPLVGRVD